MWGTERELAGAYSAPGPLTSVGVGCRHPADILLVRSFSFFLILNLEMHVKVFKFSSDEIAFFVNSRKGAQDRKETPFLGAVAGWMEAPWNSEYQVLGFSPRCAPVTAQL